MRDSPSAAALLGAVADFLRRTAAPGLAGHDAFLARVAANAALIVQRELELGPAADEEDLAFLNRLLEHFPTTRARPKESENAQDITLERVASLPADSVRSQGALEAQHTDLAVAQAQACAALREGLLGVDTPGLLQGFSEMAARRVRIEQPSYPSLQLC
jgi:hypothetical protein